MVFGLLLRLAFSGAPSSRWSAMVGAFIWLAPLATGAITVYLAERQQRRSWAYYAWAPALATLLVVIGSLLVLIEGLICAIVAQVLDALNELGRLDLLSLLPAYADAADAVARADVQAIAPVRDRAATASMVVIGTVLGDRALQGLRRIAQGNYVRRSAEQP